jgi:hypothetical protein
MPNKIAHLGVYLALVSQINFIANEEYLDILRSLDLYLIHPLIHGIEAVDIVDRVDHDYPVRACLVYL